MKDLSSCLGSDYDPLGHYSLVLKHTPLETRRLAEGWKVVLPNVIEESSGANMALLVAPKEQK